MTDNDESTMPAAAPLPQVLEKFFQTKSACDVDGTMSYFAPGRASYIDATLGWDFDSFASLRAVFEQYMPNWGPPARSYATKILAGPGSALVHMTDTYDSRQLESATRQVLVLDATTA